MDNSDDRFNYDLNDEEREEYENLESETRKKEFLEKIKQQKEEALHTSEKETTEEVIEETTEEPEQTEEQEPEPETPEFKIENPPYPTYIQERESEEKGVWVPVPTLPFVEVFKKIYRCSKHPQASNMNRGSIVNHLKANHELNLDGTELPKSLSNKPINEPVGNENEISENELNGAKNDENKLNRAKNDENKLNELENKLKGATINSEIQTLEALLARKKDEVALASSTEEPEVLVMANYNAEVAASATKIVQNIDLRFLYEKTKTLWPPEWDFATWITALVTFALNQFHIGATVWQDTDELDEDKLKFLIQVKKDWEEKLISEKRARENSISGTAKVL